MNRVSLAVSLLAACLAAGSALAVGPGKTLDFSEGAAGTVIFDGSTHQAAGLSCKECHNADLFPSMKKGTVRITMDAIYAGKYCGKCHDGQKAFNSKDNCDRCHYKAGA